MKAQRAPKIKGQKRDKFELIAQARRDPRSTPDRVSVLIILLETGGQGLGRKQLYNRFHGDQRRTKEFQSRSAFHYTPKRLPTESTLNAYALNWAEWRVDPSDEESITYVNRYPTQRYTTYLPGYEKLHEKAKIQKARQVKLKVISRDNYRTEKDVQKTRQVETPVDVPFPERVTQQSLDRLHSLQPKNITKDFETSFKNSDTIYQDICIPSVSKDTSGTPSSAKADSGIIFSKKRKDYVSASPKNGRADSPKNSFKGKKASYHFPASEISERERAPPPGGNGSGQCD